MLNINNWLLRHCSEMIEGKHSDNINTRLNDIFGSGQIYGYSGYSVPEPFPPRFSGQNYTFKNFLIFFVITAVTPGRREFSGNELQCNVVLAYSNRSISRHLACRAIQGCAVTAQGAL